MKKLTLKQQKQLMQRWKDIEKDVEVTDFQTALKRCEQQCAKNLISYYRKQRKEYQRKARLLNINNINEREHNYRKLYYAKIENHNYKFLGVVKKKYGSLSMYHFSKL